MPGQEKNVLYQHIWESSRYITRTLDKAPSRPFDSCGDQHPSSIVPSPHKARFRLDSKTSTTRDFGCFGGCQVHNKVIKVNMKILINEYALRGLRADGGINRLYVAVCARQEMRAILLRRPISDC